MTSAESDTAAAKCTQRIESAVQKKDSGDFNKALSEVNDYMKSNPNEAKEFQNSVMKGLENDHLLPQVTIFELKDKFSDIEFQGNGVLNNSKINFYKRTIQNPLEQELLDRQTTINSNTQGLVLTGVEQNLLAAEQKEDNRKLLNHLFQRPGDGVPSLYERLADEKGNIPPSAIKHLRSSDRSLPDDDKRTLSLLNANGNGTPFMDDYSNDRLKKLVEANDAQFGIKEYKAPSPNVPSTLETSVIPGADSMAPDPPPATTADGGKQTGATNPTETVEVSSTPDIQTVKAGGVETTHSHDSGDDLLLPADDTSQRSDARKTSTAAAREDRPSTSKTSTAGLNDLALVAEAATIKKANESYAHCAQRLLELANHRDFSGKQLKELSHLLWVSNGSKRAGSLHVNAHLRVTDEVMNYLEALDSGNEQQVRSHSSRHRRIAH